MIESSGNDNKAHKSINTKLPCFLIQMQLSFTKFQSKPLCLPKMTYTEQRSNQSYYTGTLI